MNRRWHTIVTGDYGLAAQGATRTGFIEGFIFLALTSNALTFGLAASPFLISALAVGVTVGVSLGLAYLSSQLFKPDQPKPEDVQNSVKNPTAARQRHYGRVKTSGPWAFGESERGNFHKVIALGTGELDAIEELWMDSTIVTVDESGWATGGVFDGDTTLRILTRRGLATEAHYSQLTAVFPEWDSSHRGDGVSSLYARQRAVRAENISKNFPNLTQTLYRVVARGSKIFNPSTGLTAWSDNAAAIIRDYMTHADAMRLPVALMTTPQATAGWLAAYNRAAEAVPRKAGGTENRYRLWGSYRFDERPADVLGRMMQSCDARIVPTPDGGVTLDIGTWEEPSVIIDADTITGFSEVSRGRDILTTANVITATYLGVNHDYQAVDADRWIDDADVSERGEIVSDIAVNLAPSHGQARRLMKLAAYRANPSWVGTFQCNLKGVAAFGKRFVRITYPLFSIDEVFEIIDFRFNIGEGGILAGVTLQVASMPAEAYAWDAETEEGTEPISESVTVDDTIPLPTGFSFDVDWIAVAGQQVPFGVIAFDPPPSEGLRVEGRYKLTSSSEWNVIAIGDDATEAQTNALSDGEEYEAQVRHVTLTGRQGEWTASQTLTPVANPTPPLSLITASATSGVATFNAIFTTRNDSNLAAVAVYATPAGQSLVKASHIVARIPVSLGIGYSIPILADGGLYDIRMYPENQSSIEGPVAGPYTNVRVGFFDNFNRANQNLENANWTRTGGSATDLQIISNGLAHPVTVNDTVYRSPDIGVVDQYVRFKNLISGSGAATAAPFVCVCLVDSQNFIALRAQGNTNASVRLYTRIAGTFTALDADVAKAVNDVFEVTRIGNSISLYKNGALVQGPISVSDAVFDGVTRAGLVTRASPGASAIIDDYENGPLV